jgi:hypothetical protein
MLSLCGCLSSGWCEVWEVMWAAHADDARHRVTVREREIAVLVGGISCVIYIWLAGLSRTVGEII